MKALLRDVCPPIVLRGVRRFQMARMRRLSEHKLSSDEQDLDLYWHP